MSSRRAMIVSLVLAGLAAPACGGARSAGAPSAASTPDPVAMSALTELFLSCFSAPELRRFVAYSFGDQGSALRQHLPGETATPAQLAQATAELLASRGLIGDPLWAALLDERPYRAEDIERVKALF